MSFFGVGANPFATPVGMKIEKATSPTLASEDWSLNMEICDLVNQSEEGPRDAMKALRKRLTTHPKNYASVMYTLTVVETCVKNCGKRFHTLVCSKDFVQELVKLIGPKNDPPAAVQEKVLSLIQSWAETFRHQPDMSGVSQIYADLKHKGVEFPASTEQAAPILTPQKSAELHSTPLSSASPPQRQSSLCAGDPPGVASASPAMLTSEQKAKLHSELDLVESNSKVLAEMLNELSPGKEQPEDLQLLQDLHATCRTMQERVVELVGRVSDDHLTADLLRINDDLNNLFVRYDRHVSKNRAISNTTGSPVKSPHVPLPESPKKEDEAPLIDLGEEAAVDQLASLNIGKKNEDVDFDTFAQSRTVPTNEKSTEPQSVDCSLAQDQRPSDFDEMEEWLKQNQTAASAQNGAAGRVLEESMSSSEFDKFLAERAAAADSLPSAGSADSVPTIPAATGSSSIQQQQQTRSRTLTKDDQNGKQLFSL